MKMDEAREFWEPIVFVEGKMDEGKVMDELADYLVVLTEVPNVYWEITGGLLSKPNYPAEAVLAKYRERNYDKWCTDKDIAGMVKDASDLDELRDLLVDYFDLHNPDQSP